MGKKIVLAISGSPRSPSFTEKMLDLCLEGMGDGIEARKFHPHRMKIGYCLGCWHCWDKKSAGICVQQDDFTQILDAYKEADYLLIAAPLYIFSFPAIVKNVLDRFFVILEPAQLKSPRGGTEHPRRFGRHPKTVLISSCGFPEVENFDLLRGYFRKVCGEFGWDRAGEILIPASGAANARGLFDRKYELLRQAGAELLSGNISEETTRMIAKPVISAEDYRKLCTANFEGGVLGKIKTAYIYGKVMLKKALDGGRIE